MVADYLKALSHHALEQIRGKLALHITARDVQWVLTVPATWDERKRTSLQRVAEASGMICPEQGADNQGSRHKLLFVTEQQAASLQVYYGLQHSDFGDRM